MKLSRAHKQYLFKQQFIPPAIINFLINGMISWLLLRHSEIINIWTGASVGKDILLTGALLPIIICMINSRLVAVQVYKGKIAPIPEAEIRTGGWHNRSILLRSLFLGVLGVLFFALPTIFIMMKFWPEPILVWDYVIFKAIWAAVLAAIVSPVIAIWAITDASVGEYKRKR